MNNIKNNGGYRAYRKKQRKALLLYIAANLILCLLLLQFPAADMAALADCLFTAAVLVTLASVFAVLKKPEITEGTVTGKKPDKGAGRIKYTIKVKGESGSLFCCSPDGTEFETGEDVYVIGRTSVIKKEAFCIIQI